MPNHTPVLAFATVAVLAGCMTTATGETMSSGTTQQDLTISGILQSNRLRLETNAAQLTRVAQTTCADGYVLELYAPPELSWAEVRDDTSKTSHRALFWVVRVPNPAPHATVTITAPNALDKPEWFAEKAVDRKWQKVPKPPSLGSAHASTVDSPVTFKQTDVKGDLVLPTVLSNPVARVLGSPRPGQYRIHFPAFTANIGGKDCKLKPSYWDVVLR